MIFKSKYIVDASNLKEVLIVGVAILFAVGFHFSFTISLQENDIRVSVTDFLLPFAFLFIVFEIYRRKWIPTLKIKNGWIWLIILTVWILVSFFVGVLYTGSIQKWALVNKVIGWFVLMCNFFCGAWIGNNKYKIKKIFLISFIGTSFIMALYGLISYWLFLYNFNIPFSIGEYRVEGFIENPNAFGIIMACIFILQIPFIENEPLFNKKLHYFVSSIVLLAIYYSLSRSAWIGLIIGIVGIIIIKRNYWRPILISIFLGIFLNIMIFELPVYITQIEETVNVSPEPSLKDKKLSKNNKFKQFRINRTTKLTDFGIKVRFKMFKDSVNYWKEHPFIGVGIGGYYWKSKIDKINPDGYYIHNTPLWLLTETGLVGFLLFSFFFLYCFLSLIRESNNYESISFGVAGILMVMLGASIGTEILYQRYLWFILGLSLVKAPNYRK